MQHNKAHYGKIWKNRICMGDIFWPNGKSLTAMTICFVLVWSQQDVTGTFPGHFTASPASCDHKADPIGSPVRSARAGLFNLWLMQESHQILVNNKLAELSASFGHVIGKPFDGLGRDVCCGCQAFPPHAHTHTNKYTMQNFTGKPRKPITSQC